jgi:hypothetical protein
MRGLTFAAPPDEFIEDDLLFARRELAPFIPSALCVALAPGALSHPVDEFGSRCPPKAGGPHQHRLCGDDSTLPVSYRFIAPLALGSQVASVSDGATLALGHPVTNLQAADSLRFIWVCFTSTYPADLASVAGCLEDFASHSA